MNRKLSVDEMRLLALAETQYPGIRDPDVLQCWHVVIEAVSQQWLRPEEVPLLIRELETGGGLGAEEYSIDVDQEGGDLSQVVVSFIAERYRCPRAAMLEELRRLWDWYRGEPESPNGGGPASGGPDVPPHGPGGSADAAAIATDVDRLIAALAAPGGAASPGEVSREAQQLLEAWLSAAAESSSSVPMRRALEALLAQDPTRLAAALRTLTRWGERPATGGERVDRLIRDLERWLGPVLTAGRAADERQTTDRIAATARDSIARRVQEAAARDKEK